MLRIGCALKPSNLLQPRCVPNMSEVKAAWVAWEHVAPIVVQADLTLCKH